MLKALKYAVGRRMFRGGLRLMGFDPSKFIGFTGNWSSPASAEDWVRGVLDYDSALGLDSEGALTLIVSREYVETDDGRAQEGEDPVG